MLQIFSLMLLKQSSLLYLRKYTCFFVVNIFDNRNFNEMKKRSKTLLFS